MTITVSDNDTDTGKRLDLFLSLKLPEYSRSFIKKTIESNQVIVNEEVCFKAGYKIRAGDRIEFPEIQPQKKEIIPSAFDLEILFEDEDYLFINKPVGLTVHPTRPEEHNTLVNKLVSYRSDLPGNNFLRPGIVHRLDKDTSGVLVIAKNPKSLWWLSQQFADRKVQKQYISIGLHTESNLTYSEGKKISIESNLVRSTRDRKQFISQPLTQGQGRFAKTSFEILSILKMNSSRLIALEIFPKTGRTHQIRVHQRALNMPILGDPIYLSKKERDLSTEIVCNLQIEKRLYLHAKTISFENYNKRLYCISAQVPKDFLQIGNFDNEKSEPKKYTKNKQDNT